MYTAKFKKDIRCPLEFGLEVFGGRWKSRVICVLAHHGTLRYSEIRKEMGNVTDAVLSATLKELIGYNIVERIQYNEIPPRVEYFLSDSGKSIMPILNSICKWAGNHLKTLNTTEFDIVAVKAEISKSDDCAICDYKNHKRERAQ